MRIVFCEFKTITTENKLVLPDKKLSAIRYGPVCNYSGLGIVYIFFIHFNDAPAHSYCLKFVINHHRFRKMNRRRDQWIQTYSRKLIRIKHCLFLSLQFYMKIMKYKLVYSEIYVRFSIDIYNANNFLNN